MQNPLFSIKDLFIKTKNIQRLSIKSFDIHRGAIYTISGKPGSGKTTFLESITNKISIDKNMIIYENNDIRNTSRSLMLKEITYVPQIIKPCWGSVNKYMIKTISKTNHLRDDAEKHVRKICKKMNCSYLLQKKMRELTPGQLRWITLAASIASDSKVLIIDEIEQHLTKKMYIQLTNILYKKTTQDGTSIILSTLTPETINQYSSVVITLSDGRITSVRSSKRRK